MGTEVEYGISVPGEPGINPVITSTQVVLAYAASVAAPRARRARWDYEVESPLRDARGYDLSSLFGPAMEPDIDDIGAANVILSNGARLYVDHAHPEFSGPEVTNPMDAVLLRQGRRAGDGAGGAARDRRSWREAVAAVQEQRRRQGGLLRHPRELPVPSGHPVPVADLRADPVLRLAPGVRRRRAGRHRPGRSDRRDSSWPNDPTTSRSRSAWRPRSSAGSSTPATSRTPTPTGSDGCT